MQVVTNENFQQLVETGKVDEYKPPVAAEKQPDKAEAKDAPAGAEQPRGEDGKFVKADEKVDEAAKPAADESEEGAEFTGWVKDKFDRIVNKKHRAMKEAEEFARQLYGDKTAAETRAEALQRELDALKGTKSGPAAVKDSKEPNPDDFKTVGEYAEALAEYKVEKKFAEREAKQVQERQEAAARAAQADLNKRIAETVKEIPDYADVINESDLDLPPHMAVYIAESTLGPKIGYHLAKNPQEFDRLAKLSPIRAIAELGKLEDRLDKKPDTKAETAAAPVATVSRAPAPIKPLDGSAATVQKDPAKMTLQELRAYENERRAAKARR